MLRLLWLLRRDAVGQASVIEFSPDGALDWAAVELVSAVFALII